MKLLFYKLYDYYFSLDPVQEIKLPRASKYRNNLIEIAIKNKINYS